MPLSFRPPGSTIAAFDWSEQVFAVAIPRMLTLAARRLGLALLLGGLLLGGLRAEWDFSQISRRAQGLYGPLGPGQARIDAWQALLSTHGQGSEMARLQAVNRFFNQQLRYVEDIDLWREVDYWATPIQALLKGAGDCEDYAIAKYFSLRRMGIPRDKLRITYVKALQQNRAHMVLTYYSSPQAQPLVLDSLIDAIRLASERTDLLPVYAFNGEGLWLTGASGNRKVGDTKRLSRWQDVLKKMQAEGFPAEPVY
ncbi:transglutaminase-like cysteine peptidase [Pseudomonas guariconensis]|uniref:cysteine protease LapG n=1 Tax=Pseudomonas TaxID=286 RepID=UPI002096AEE3|nr:MULTISPECIES: transglutaminase-like cysteine peptidase [Pseudomonas]MCO7641977.1 transglutaminase-like cysteine peptidase [Pseudomonas sp. S 311-6]MCO7516757.1 transglutaminase-like cysteine peptidase [Pseudomonas putida]MCO7566990.1 transglutaminase-like cysteine peptidase [Pseudomonas mosselii]MCO7607163.1 transglutaminase-like cysteine peptidase [Pseudomonas guariconensis]MCO7618340.1 transglutaminase-like cysteine peptidase [Pseudomonas guariconensis]